MALRMGTIFVLFLFFVDSRCILFSLKDGIKFAANYLLDVQFYNISSSCYYQLIDLRENLINPGSDYWGIQMVDASSKVQSGIMSLNIGELGNFEQCISTKGNLSNGETVRGKYCLGHLSMDPEEIQKYTAALGNRIQEQLVLQKKSSAINNLATNNNTMIHGPTWAGCFPDGCSTQDINKIVNQVIESFMFTNITIVFEDMLCQTEKDVHSEFTSDAIFTIAFLLCYAIFLCICTGYDVICRYINEEPTLPLVAFSVYTNTQKLFSITENENQMFFLNGLKVISMMWVVIGHQYSITCGGPVTSTVALMKWADSLHSMFIISGTISVDTFLVIGAFLLTIYFLKEKKKNRPIPIYKFYLQRYLRLTPSLAAMVLISATLLVYLGSGPRWPFVKPYFQDNCVNYWWSTLLYIQNYVNVKNMCLGQTWYLSIDVQLFLLSPILLTCLYKWGNKTCIVIGICIVISMLLSFYISWTNELTALLSNPFGNIDNYSNKYYLLTHTRAAPWFLGVLVGYAVTLYPTDDFPKWIKEGCTKFSWLIWIICLAILLTCVLIGHHDLRQVEYDKWKNALYIALVRPAWAIGICWVIYACATDNGAISKLVNSILGYRNFQIMGRFTYAVYLVHVTLMYLISFARKSPIYFSDFEMIQRFWGSLFLSLALAYVWILAFESPFITLEKVLRENTRIEPEQPKTPSKWTTSCFTEQFSTSSRESETSSVVEEEIGIASLPSGTEDERTRSSQTPGVASQEQRGITAESNL